MPRKLGSITSSEFIQDHLQDETSDFILSDETKVREISELMGSKKKRKSSGGAGGGDGEENGIVKKMKMLRDAMGEEEEDEEKPKKKAKMMGDKDATTTVFHQEVEAMKLYGSKNVAELKDVLRWNLGYGMTGTKDVLLMR